MDKSSRGTCLKSGCTTEAAGSDLLSLVLLAGLYSSSRWPSQPFRVTFQMCERKRLGLSQMPYTRKRHDKISAREAHCFLGPQQCQHLPGSQLLSGMPALLVKACRAMMAVSACLPGSTALLAACWELVYSCLNGWGSYCTVYYTCVVDSKTFMRLRGAAALV